MLKKVIIGIVAVLLLFVGAIVVFVFVIAKAPYTIPEDRISGVYLRTQNQLGSFQLINDFGENPVEQDDGSLAAFYSKDGKSAKEGESETIVAFGREQSRVDSIMENIKNFECTSLRVDLSGNVNGAAYYKGACDNFSYYIYQTPKGWLSFTTPGGEEALKELVEAYSK